MCHQQMIKTLDKEVENCGSRTQIIRVKAWVCTAEDADSSSQYTLLIVL